MLYGDNKGAIALIKNPEFYAKTKHIDVAVHYVRELFEDNQIQLEFTPTTDMVADLLTKPLGKQRHQQLVEKLFRTSSN